MKEVEVEPSEVRFKFGDNNPTISSKRYKMPATVCNKKVTIVAEVVEDNIPLLISKKSMSDAKMVLDFGNNTVTAFNYTQNLLYSESGHCSIPLKDQSIHDDICLCSQGNVVLLNNEDPDKKKMVVFWRQGGLQIKCHISRVVNSNDMYKSDKVNVPPDEKTDEEEAPESLNAARALFLHKKYDDKEGDGENIQNSMPVEDDIPQEIEEVPSSEEGDCLKIQKLCEIKSKLEKKLLTVLVQKDDPFAKEKLEEIEKWNDSTDVFEEQDSDEEDGEVEEAVRESEENVEELDSNEVEGESSEIEEDDSIEDDNLEEVINSTNEDEADVMEEADENETVVIMFGNEKG